MGKIGLGKAMTLVRESNFSYSNKVKNPLYEELQEACKGIEAGDHWARVAAQNLAVNKKMKIGTVLRHHGYVVDLYRVVAAEDADEHWRGDNNLMFTLMPIHSQGLGDLTVGYKQNLTVLHSYDLAEPLYTDWTIEEEA
jgi:hypothetical protein